MWGEGGGKGKSNIKTVLKQNRGYGTDLKVVVIKIGRGF